MPKPGNNLKSVYAAEMHLDQRLKDVLISVEQALTPSASSEAIELVSIPLERRAAYQDWLRHQLKHPCDDVRPRALAGPAKLALDSLFANLMVTINQTLVHAFVHWNRGDYDLANSTWEMSGAAMMHATSIVNSFAVRHIAPDPTRAVLLGKVAKPCLAQVRSDALANDLLLANQCYAIAQQAVVNQQEADLTATCGRVKTYYDELISWRPGQQLPELENPCVDFERVLRSYVRSSRASAASSDS